MKKLVSLFLGSVFVWALVGVGSVSADLVLVGNFQDCSTVSGFVPQEAGLGCACNYTYADVTNSPFIVKCDSNLDLVCSQNNYTPQIPVKTSANQAASERTVTTFCLKKVNQSCVYTSECEQNSICENGICTLDIGGSVVEGLVGDEVGDIRDTIRRFINIALGFLGVLVVIFIIYGGVLWLTAAGSEEKIEKGKKTLLWAAIGAIVISIAWTIASYVLQIGKTIG